jgi:hypothetical protein
MPKSNFLAHSLANLVLRNQAEPTLWQPHTVGNKTVYYWALHTADPGPAGNQSTNEVSYTGYARQPINRDAAAWDLPATVADVVNPVDFPIPSAGSGSAPYASIGDAASGAGNILYYGPLTPAIVIAVGVTPQILDTSTITEA